MDDGELTPDQKTQVNEAVSAAEEITGLEFCVIVGSQARGDARHEAEHAFHKLGMHERPAVMIMVVKSSRTLEVVTAPELSDRLPDAQCKEAADLMTRTFASGDIAGGLTAGVATLARLAGPRSDGQNGRQGQDLPNIVDLDDPNLN